MTGGGPARFARFAYPPNALGLCGPDDHRALLEAAGSTGAPAEAELRHLAPGFAGAWPYLQLIAAANGIDDPLDDRVVTAYWIGNDLLHAVPAAWLADQSDERFRRMASTRFEHVADAVLAGGRPHHNFHVFNVYPWVGLLRGDRTGEPLRVLDQCRIRSAVVVAGGSDTVEVAGTRLVWDGDRLGEQPATQRLPWQWRGTGPGPAPAVGAAVALHWDWICQPITHAEAASLRRWTAHHLALANRILGREPAALG